MEGQTVTNPNPSVPDPNAYPASSPQQSSYQYQGGVPPQGVPQSGIQQQGIQQNWAAQPGNGAAAQGYAFVIELSPGNHGDGGDGLYWLAVGMIFYVLPIGLILVVAGIIAAIVSAVMNSSSRS